MQHELTRDLHQPLILVTGGTGKTGRRIAAKLQALDIPVRIGSRQASPAFDWENRRTWAPALTGVTAAYLAYQPDLAVPGANAAIRHFIELAERSGVKRLVLLSGRGEEEAEQCERLLQNAGLDYSARQLVQPELQREFSGGLVAGR